MMPYWNSHRGVSVFTLDGLIWSIVEYRLPARSRLCRDQLTVVAAPDRCASTCVASAKTNNTANAATMHRTVTDRTLVIRPRFPCVFYTARMPAPSQRQLVIEKLRQLI